MTGRYERDARGRPLRFTGEQQDADVSGLYYLRARYYDPTLGRFWSQDPWGGSTASPQTLNPFPYAGSNPANLVDPYGLCGLGSWGDFTDCIVDPISSGMDFFIDAIYESRTPVTRALEAALLAGSGGDIKNKEGGIRVVRNCTGFCAELLDAVGQGAITVGRTIFSTSASEGVYGERLLRHEMRHVSQYEFLGDAFLVVYFGPAKVGAFVACSATGDLSRQCMHDRNILEILAD